MYETIMNSMYGKGVWAENDPREPWFLCAAHTDEIIDETLNKFQESVKTTLQ
jgi:glutamate-1-semialdehyde aminotransferase